MKELLFRFRKILIFFGLAIFSLYLCGCGEDKAGVGENVIDVGIITGFVSDSNTRSPISGVQVSVEEGPSATTDSNGQYTLSKVALGTNTIKFTVSGYIEAKQEVKVKPDEPVKLNIFLTPGVKVSGTVTADSGNPVSGVKVSLGDRSRFTDDTGKFTLIPVVPGTYNMTAEKPGYKSVSAVGIVVGKDGVVKNLTIERQMSGKILYERGLGTPLGVKASFGIGVVRIEDNNGVPLTDLKDRFPSWAPNGSRIVFQGRGQGPWRIHVMNADGTGIASISGSSENDVTPAWSPDNKRIAFVHWDILGKPAIFTMTPTGTDRKKVIESHQEARPTWSSDGSRLAYMKSDEKENNRDIYVVSLDGANEIRLTSDPAIDLAPDWAPDGSNLVFTRAIGDLADIYTVDLFSGSGLKLTKTAAFNGPACWSPDGTKIAFSSNRDGSFGIYIMDADGSNQTKLYNNPGEDEFIAQGGWSN